MVKEISAADVQWAFELLHRFPVIELCPEEKREEWLSASNIREHCGSNDWAGLGKF